jgi:hypothetical protein
MEVWGIDQRARNPVILYVPGRERMHSSWDDNRIKKINSLASHPLLGCPVLERLSLSGPYRSLREGKESAA